MFHYSPGIRAKLILIFVFIKVLPLVVLAWFAWEEIFSLGTTVEKNYVSMVSGTREVVKGVSDLSTENSIRALDQRSREAIERLTTDTARAVAAFLYERDTDIQLAAQLEPGRSQYERFLSDRHRPVILHEPWVMDPSGETWVPGHSSDIVDTRAVLAQNDDNRRDFNYRKPSRYAVIEQRPTYLEMTYVDLKGREKVKVTMSDILPATLFDVSDSSNTYCRAERYFQELKRLKPGEIYVSEVIGPYVKGHMVGPYSRVRAKEKGIPFQPEASGYAGKENPVGIRFQGLVRWATPVVRNNRIQGYVTLALDHTHLMEFTDHIVPTEERYSAISDAASGNYAFMWDYLGRNISHPRDYFIVGYDPETGEQAVPWLDEEMYEIWTRCNGSMKTFQEIAPQFQRQGLSKKAAKPLTDAGMLGLDGRYLNFAPQCAGWHNLTQYGGSGSFLIFWSGLWKLTTAASVPYYTGRYGQHPRGFGYVTIGANVDEFHRSALETAETIQRIGDEFSGKLDNEKRENQALIDNTLQKAFKDLSFYTGIMIVIVIAIAVFIAATLTRRITGIVQGIRRFQDGDRSYRLETASRDEMGQLSSAYNEMADTLEHYIDDLEASKIELAKHRDNLEDMVKERTKELEKEITERKKVEENQLESQERLRNQNQTLLRLAGEDALHLGDIEISLQMLMEAAGKVLQVERSSVWLFDEYKIIGKCHEIYLLSSNRHCHGGEFRVEDYPTYMKALERDRTIAAFDAYEDERLTDLRNNYMLNMGIRSMLDAAIVMDGEIKGFVKFEQVNTVRDWHMDEQNFAHSIADMVALAMAAANRRQESKEKEQLEVRLRRVEKMEAIGTLAGGVAHDLNNILSGLVSYPELLLYRMGSEDPMRKPVETIVKSGKRAATIVQDLLTLARRGVEATEVINLNDVVQEYLISPEHERILTLHPTIHLSTKLSSDLMNIRGSSAHLTKVLMNLFINAAEAMANGGEISISTENCYIDRPIKGYDMVKEGDYAAMNISDTGKGISPEDMNHIFEPFYTNKTMGRSGTGLGMSVVWGVVKDHGGYIDFESSEGRGSRFTLYFPITRESIAKAEGHSIDEFRGHGESILVVDDIREQREIASAILVELGYEVTTVESGEEALDRLKASKFDLLVLDMIMDPGMDGLDTYREVLRLNPNQKALIASGFSESERISEAKRLGASHAIKKPYTIGKIGLTVQTALAA